MSEHELWILLSRFFRGKQEAKEIYEQIVSEELYTFMNVLDNLYFDETQSIRFDGNKKHRDLLKELKKNGYTVHVHSRGEEARYDFCGGSQTMTVDEIRTLGSEGESNKETG